MVWRKQRLLLVYILCLNGSLVSMAASDDNHDFECDPPPEEVCIDATLCSTINKELLLSNNNLTRAQFKYCHHKEANDPNKYGYGPIKAAKGPPMACCSQYDVIHFDKNKICSEKIPALRRTMCGRPSVFYLNFPVMVYMIEKDATYSKKILQSDNLLGGDCLDTIRHNIHEKKKRCVDSKGTITKGKDRREVKPKETAFNGYYANAGHRIVRRSEDRRLERRRQKRFTGGRAARMGQFPFMAVLYFTEVYDNKAYVGCLGTIIHQSIVLTTYNCLLKGVILEVWAGKFSVSNNTHEPQEFQWVNTVLYKVEPEPQRRLFKHAVAPPEAKFQARHNGTLLNPHDLLLIRVDKEFIYNDFVQPVCLHVTPHSLEKDFDSQGISVGYGMHSEFRDKGRMRYALMDRVSADHCEKRYSYYYERPIDITTLRKEYQYMCYGGNGEESSPCYMDEGSPLLRVDKETGHLYQWGVLLQRMPGACGLRDLPAIYVSLHVHYKWFEYAIPKVLQMQTPSYNKNDPHQCLTENEKNLLKL